jgi:mannose-6-phosphate isomerase-like protein (cupin superfamily)
MSGSVTNIERATLENENFRKLLFTGLNSQLVVISLQPGEDIGLETHHPGQFVRISQGEARLIS